jgi:hypothetical protein
MALPDEIHCVPEQHDAISGRKNVVAAMCEECRRDEIFRGAI